MSLQKMTVQYVGGTLYLPPLEREVNHIVVRNEDVKDWEHFEQKRAGDDYKQAAEYWQRMYEESFTERACDNCDALNRAAGLWAKADKRARELEQSIVRCRDCKRMRDWTAEEELASYDKEELADGWCMFLRIGTYDDFFCAWGKRKAVSE